MVSFIYRRISLAELRIINSEVYIKTYKRKKHLQISYFKQDHHAVLAASAINRHTFFLISPNITSFTRTPQLIKSSIIQVYFSSNIIYYVREHLIKVIM